MGNITALIKPIGRYREVGDTVRKQWPSKGQLQYKT
jgi:hypothetical protein